MWSYFLKGGIMMWPIIGCSVLSVAIIIDRLIFYHKSRTPHNFIAKILDLAGRKEMEKALQMCKDSHSSVIGIIKYGLVRFNEGRESMEKAMEEAGLSEVPRLEKYLPILAAISSTATLMGFTGTVMGMIRAFNDIVQHGISSPTVVARGIAEALITTAAGLFVAIPTILFYHYFSHIVERRTIEMEQYSAELFKMK